MNLSSLAPSFPSGHSTETCQQYTYLTSSQVALIPQLQQSHNCSDKITISESHLAAFSFQYAVNYVLKAHRADDRYSIVNGSVTLVLPRQTW